jgi:hypothetical protein
MVQGRIQRTHIAQVVHLLVVGSGKAGVGMHMSESKEDSEATKGDLSRDERED